MPFALENFVSGSERQSFSEEWLPPADVGARSFSDFVCPLNNLLVSELSFNELYLFYIHPVRTWFQQRLSVWFCREALELATDEPFIVDGLTRYQINKKLVNTLIDQKDTNILYRQIRAAGVLPYGAFGELYWMKQCQAMATLAEQVRKWFLPEKQDMEILLIIDNIKLNGWLPQVQANGLLRWHPRLLAVKDGLLLWLEHLAYCAMGGEGESRVFGSSDEWRFAPLPAEQAKEHLSSLISGYCQGMRTPLLLLNRSGGAWLTQCFNKSTKSIDWEEDKQQQARNKLIDTWQGDKYITGEGDDPYLKRLISPLNETHIKAIISAAQRYFLPPFIFNEAQDD